MLPAGGGVGVQFRFVVPACERQSSRQTPCAVRPSRLERLQDMGFDVEWWFGHFPSAEHNERTAHGVCLLLWRTAHGVCLLLYSRHSRQTGCRPWDPGPRPPVAIHTAVHYPKPRTTTSSHCSHWGRRPSTTQSAPGSQSIQELTTGGCQFKDGDRISSLIVKPPIGSVSINGNNCKYYLGGQNERKAQAAGSSKSMSSKSFAAAA